MGAVLCTDVNPNLNDSNNKSKKRLTEPCWVMATGQGIANISSQELGNPQQNYFQFEDFSFSSKFEAGNLSLVQKTSAVSYNLWIAPDCYKTGHQATDSSWFYFAVKLINPYASSQQKLTFTIKNLPTTLHASFEAGLMPIFKSSSTKNEWQYMAGPLSGYRIHGDSMQISFEYTFTTEDKEAEFAFSFPYTLKKWEDFIQSVEKDQEDNAEISFVREILGESLEGRSIESLIITGHDDRSKPITKLDSSGGSCSTASGGLCELSLYKNKKYVLITCRTNPGESPTSYILEGFLKRLFNQKDQVSKAALKSYVFVVVPMLNPDGVVRGHSKTDTRGKELSKVFDKSAVESYPGPVRVKALAKKLSENNVLEITIDLRASFLTTGVCLHGSRLYDTEKNIQIQLLTRLMDVYSKDFIHAACTYKDLSPVPQVLEEESKSGEKERDNSPTKTTKYSVVQNNFTLQTLALSKAHSTPVTTTNSRKDGIENGCRDYMAQNLSIDLAFTLETSYFKGIKEGNPYIGKDINEISSHNDTMSGSKIDSLQTWRTAKDLTSPLNNKANQSLIVQKAKYLLLPKDYLDTGGSLVDSLVEFRDAHPNSILPQTGFGNLQKLIEYVQSRSAAD